RDPLEHLQLSLPRTGPDTRKMERRGTPVAQEVKHPAKQAQNQNHCEKRLHRFHSMLRVEVRDPDTHDGFDNYYFAESSQPLTDEDVDVFARRARHLDDAALFEGQDLRHLHPSLVELDFDFDPDIPDMGDFLLRAHALLSASERLSAAGCRLP
ncbi:MAG: hypothetical protein QOJ99_5093, partial [Bryobacterales bacterium]|nr:hypothetical protein [Bryobacterales bacterium]